MAENKRILVVDDEESMRHMLNVLLTQEGYAVDSAGNGKAALDKVEEEGYDIILADVRMPKMDGKSLLKELQKRRKENGNGDRQDVVEPGPAKDTKGAGGETDEDDAPAPLEGLLPVEKRLGT